MLSSPSKRKFRFSKITIFNAGAGGTPACQATHYTRGESTLKSSNFLIHFPLAVLINKMSSSPVRHIMLTGPPGIGKTTIIKKVCRELQLKNVSMKGFYTSELRQGGKRIGFDVISLDGTVKPLARVGESVGPKVGQYVVQTESFENIALPALLTAGDESVIVIDEIGKMELFSRGFETAVKNVLSSDKTILGTIPIQKGRPIQVVEFIRSHPSVRLIAVNSGNRDHLVSDIVNLLSTLL